MASKKVTIKDIAEYVGVSTMTVSYVLNKNPNQSISAETTQKVLDAVEKLHYIPNHAAKALRLNRTFCIAVVIEKNFLVRKYATVIEGIRAYLEARGYSMLLCTSAHNRSNNPVYLNMYMENKADGIIFIARDGRAPEDGAIKTILKDQIPFVVLDCDKQMDVSSVSFDYYKEAMNQIAYLASQKIKHIVYLMPDWDIRQERVRKQAVMDGIQDYGIHLEIEVLHYDMEKIDTVKHVENDFYADTDKMLKNIWQNIEKKDSEETAIVCSWGVWVENLLNLSIREGLSMKIASLGVCNINPELWPNVSCSYLPFYEGGELCAKRLLERLEGDKSIYHDVIGTDVESQNLKI